MAEKTRRATCTDVHFVFARGTYELQGFGILGAPLNRAFSSAYTSYSSYAVVYAAAVDQNSLLGSVDAERNMAGEEPALIPVDTDDQLAIVAACPSTRIILGGYSQGAS